MHKVKTMRRLRMLRLRQYSAEQERQRLEAASGCGAWFLEGWTRKIGKCVNGDGDQSLQTRAVKKWCKAYIREKRHNSQPTSR